jgi:hypothetical protein
MVSGNASNAKMAQTIAAQGRREADWATCKIYSAGNMCCREGEDVDMDFYPRLPGRQVTHCCGGPPASNLQHLRSCL